MVRCSHVAGVWAAAAVWSLVAIKHVGALFGDCPRAVERLAMNVSQQISLQPAQLRQAASRLRESGGRLEMAYAWYPEPHRIELRYVATEADQREFAIWRCSPTGPMPSLTDSWPLMGWFEREITDLFGLGFSEHPEPRRLVLHAGVNPVLPPLEPGYPPDTQVRVKSTRLSVPEVTGAQADVQLLPFGPGVPTSSNRVNFFSSTSAKQFCTITRSCSSSIVEWKNALRACQWPRV